MFRLISISAIVIGTIGVFWVLGKASLVSKSVPNIGEYMASSTISIASTTPVTEEYTVPLKTPTGIFNVLVASTTETLGQGLSDRPSLQDDRGMLFIFASASRPGFWMKDMYFPLDIIWINSKKKVVGIHRNIMPQSYPTLYYPSTDIKYVLEINAGAAAAWGIATGTVLYF